MKALKLVFLLLAGLLLYLVLWPTGLDPQAWTPPAAPALTGAYAANDKLKDIQRIAEGIGTGPEGITVDTLGRIYAGFDDGRVVQFSPNGSVYSVLAQTHGRPLGLTTGPNGGIVIADAKLGLLHYADKLTVWSQAAGNLPFGFTDDVVGSSAGKCVYFTDASNKFGYGRHMLDLLEHGAHGRLLRYDLATKQVTVLLEGLHFANGVALGPDDAYVLVNETGEYRIVRYWLKGEKAGTHDVFIDNLPGFPDNLSFNGRDRFWVALFSPRDALLDELLPGNFFLRKVSARLPAFAQPRPHHMAFALGLDLEGHVVANLQYDAPEAYAPITSVREFGPWLYFGSLKATAMGRMPLNRVFTDAPPPPAGWENLPPAQERPRPKSWEQQHEEREEGLRQGPGERDRDEKD